MTTPYIEFRNVTKTFGGVVALSEVSLSVGKGACHALMAKMGRASPRWARRWRGFIGWMRERFSSTGGGSDPFTGGRRAAGHRHGAQELAFCPDLSVAENLVLGHYPSLGGGFFHGASRFRLAETTLAHIGMRMDVTQPMKQLSTAEEQMVQIAAANWDGGQGAGV